MRIQNRGSDWLIGPPRKPNASTMLICFPHGGGGATSYRKIMEAAGPDLDVIAVQLAGRGPRIHEPAIDSLVEVLNELVPVLVKTIDRPYALFGHSVGALLAFECALRLEQSVSEPPLGLFVSSYPDPACSIDDAPN
ncbi:MAG: alpha/beta fold hydrolase, partial [Pseudomonadota bacterium]